MVATLLSTAKTLARVPRRLQMHEPKEVARHDCIVRFKANGRETNLIM